MPTLPTANRLIRAWRAHYGESQAAFGLRCGGVSDRLISRYEQGTTKPGTKQLERIAARLGMDFFAFILGPPGFNATGITPAEIPLEPAYAEETKRTFRKITVYESLPAGGWDSVSSERTSEMEVPTAMLPNRASIVAVRVRGDSMSPKIEDGAVVFLDTSSTRPRSGDIVAAYLDGEATLKTYRLQNREVWLEPFNRNYGPIRVDDTRHLRILGVYVGHFVGAGR